MLASALAFLFSRPVSADSRWGANYFPNIELTTQDGKTVHFYDDLIKGKIVAIDLIYTTCQYSCPLETARLAQVQKILGDRVGKDIFFYSITIDPANDTPAVLKAYAKKFHAGPGWTFLTGKKEDIEFLSKKLGLYSDPAATLDGHTPHLLLGNEPMGQWMRNSALDNPRFLSQMIGDFLDSFRNMKPAHGKENTESASIQLDPGQYLVHEKMRCLSHGWPRRQDRPRSGGRDGRAQSRLADAQDPEPRTVAGRKGPNHNGSGRKIWPRHHAQPACGR